MKAPTIPKVLIYRYAVILLVCHLIAWLIFYQAKLRIPGYIPKTSISIGGLAILIIIITISISFARACIMTNDHVHVGTMTLALFAINAMAEFVFQLVRIITFPDMTILSKLSLFFYSVNISTLLGGFIGWLVAMKVKGGNTRLFYIMLGIVAIISYAYGKMFLKI